MTIKNKKIHKEYTRRINIAVDYILKNIDRPLNLEEVAKASFFSPYHFHRIFHGVIGETVNDFIIRKRMQTAACRLVSKEKLSITDIAEMSGYSSSANFSKAFKQYFGLTPSQVRTPVKDQKSKIGKLYSKYGKEFDPRELYPQSRTNLQIFENEELKEILMNVNIVSRPDTRVAFLTSPKGYDLESVFETWDTIIQWADTVGVIEPDWLGICHDNPIVTPIEQCHYEAAIPIDENMILNEPYMEKTIPGGEYAKAHFSGDNEKVNQFVMEICANWLPQSGYEPDNYPLFMHYLNDSRIDGIVKLDMYLKIKPLKDAKS